MIHRQMVNCVFLMAVIMLASPGAASDTSVSFQTGPFNVSVDLGRPCGDINISKPTQSELLSGDKYVGYVAYVCDVIFSFTKYDKEMFKTNEEFGSDAIAYDILVGIYGADERTLNVAERKIDGRSGAVGSGYVPKYGARIYAAGFILSPKAVGHIILRGNESEMISALKTIHITEAA